MSDELWSTKPNWTDAPAEERSEPTDPQESSLPPLTLTLSAAAGVRLGVGFGVGLTLAFGVDLLDEDTDPGAVAGGCVVAPGVLCWAPGRRDELAEACGADVDADADGCDAALGTDAGRSARAEDVGVVLLREADA